jgi:hypothetical protein
MSASTPAGSAKRNIGNVVAACTRETIRGLGDNDIISQAAPTSCIQVPMLETTVAVQSARKTGSRNGAQGDAVADWFPVPLLVVASVSCAMVAPSEREAAASERTPE